MSIGYIQVEVCFNLIKADGRGGAYFFVSRYSGRNTGFFEPPAHLPFPPVDSPGVVLIVFIN